MADAASVERVTEKAANEIADRLEMEFAEHAIDGTPDLMLLTVSPHHASRLADIERVIARRIAPMHIIAVAAEGVISSSVEIEAAPCIAAMACRLPGVSITPFSSADLPASLVDAEFDERAGTEDLASIADVTGIRPGHRCTVLFADPFSTPLDGLLRSLARARALCSTSAEAGSEHRRGPIVGGLASASNRPGGNVMLIDGTITSTGCVGVSLAGNIKVDAIVSQGCKPFGSNHVITAAQGQFVRTLGGRPALDVLEEAVNTLSDQQRQGLSGGLLIGRVINEYKERFGRADYLMRNVVGVIQKDRAIAVADRVRVGQTIRFHMRDAQTADEDLALLLDAQALHDRPVGILLCTCNGRGTRLFPNQHHDAAAFQRAFRNPTPAETKAKAGSPIGLEKHIPLVGFFAAGEIGPVGDKVFLHAQTASALIFRAN